MCFLVIQCLKKIISDKGMSISVGDEGGFAPMISSNEEALKLIVKSIENSRLKVVPGSALEINF